MGWRAIFESFEHIAEAELCFFGRNLEDLFEDRSLHVPLMDTDRATAQFHAGKTEEAVATEQEAIKLNGHDPEFQQQLKEFQKSMKAVKGEG